MFGLGALMLGVGYAALYSGLSNALNGGQGPTFFEALGIKTAIAPPGADHPSKLVPAPPNVQTA